ncbi:class I SAM-dependent methyltransferase [Rariglobus hedericola]|uniref:Methyltransferase domain-containing protein n=1 Tax=Rariglobus hedericola TaxID=2597822 RepID=A0A556QPL3_9BACT|nr:class I SAM-dependent methyltransferase [Rariglobus hedericola]TSJ78576.1 methyltransferase domain-containing protein [Rariglobus hedericola]
MNYQAEYTDYWSRQDRWGSHSFDDADALFKRVTLISGRGSVLDVGCGMGLLVRTLLEHDVQAHGIDIAPRPIEANNAINPGHFQLGSILDLPFADNSWNTIVSTDCLEHIAEADVPKALSELYRVAESSVFICLATTRDRDGRWHLTVRNREWWEARFFAAGFRRHPLDQLITSYEARESDEWQITLTFEKIPVAALQRYPLEALKAERDLHMDMTRESGRRADAHIARYIMARRYLPSEGLVLDAACGLGYGSAVLGCDHRGVQIIGLDNSDYAVAYGRACFQPSHPNLRFEAGDVCDLSRFADASVDLVVSFETVEHLREPEHFLGEINRVLKPGGRFVCSVPNMWVDEDGKDPNPWHFHVFDFSKLAQLCTKFFPLEHVYRQTAGGGMTLTQSQRRLQRVNLPVTTSSGEAEWWLVAATKPGAFRPLTALSTQRIVVLTHAAEHPLFTSWLADFPFPVSYVTDATTDFVFPDDTALVVTFDCYREPLVTLLRRAMEINIPTLLLADGILEYRNTWDHPQLVPGSLYQPVLAHKLACLGRSQARTVESWDNPGRCEIIGSPRFDLYAARQRRSRLPGDHFRVLVMTAITPYFTEEQHARVLQSLIDLKTTFESSAIDVCWRLTKGLDAEIGVDSIVTDLTGLELAEVLQSVDAVITTPSTSMLEAMLLGLPVAVLDYNNCPHYVQAAWRITAASHIAETLVELANPPAAKLLFQNATLHDALECDTPAAPRLRQLAEKMILAGAEARAHGRPLTLPARLIDAGLGAPAALAESISSADLFPGHAPFQQNDLRALQVEVGHLRSHVAHLENNLIAPSASEPDPALIALIQERAQLTILWRSKLEAGVALASLKQNTAASRLMIEAVKAVEACAVPEVIIEALIEVSGQLASLDLGRARYLLDLGRQLATDMGNQPACDRAAVVLASFPPISPVASARPPAPQPVSV